MTRIEINRREREEMLRFDALRVGEPFIWADETNAHPLIKTSWSSGQVLTEQGIGEFDVCDVDRSREVVRIRISITWEPIPWKVAADV